ncbi:hypothetical protein BHAOGJBA_3148 [Methylobacterium hispanicum]|jgi:hypothetical protein|uniref:Uncharacterized protein n=1 Tax=Methylobacterium hispanicum TaxID=270350 RepID=A0AAV4ZMT4_9HYPH|nr:MULTISPECIES: hypothetical protein [Methylobacterium]GJD89618.1 hypothetical protein BHAOGJBA_3148 [Methylobacterium hispanicum]
MLLYVSAAWAGGTLTLAALWQPLGPALALVAAPFGASAVTAGAACLAALRPDARRGRGNPPPGGAPLDWQEAH